MAIPKEDIAVKEILSSTTPMSEEFSKILLGLDDLLVLYCECDDENDIEKPIYIYAIPKFNRDFTPRKLVKGICTKCNHADNFGVHQYTCREIDDCPIRGHRTIIRILQFSLRCPKCKRTWTPKIPSCPERARLTPRHASLITDASFQKLPFEQVAYNHHVSHTKVIELFLQEAKKRDTDYVFEAHKHIGIDETLIKTTPPKTAKPSGITEATPSESEPVLLPAIVLMATEKETDKEFKHHGIIDVIPSKRDAESVIAILEKFGKASDEIETVTMDMCSAYRLAVETALPKARIIVDRFHLVQSLNDKLKRSASKLYFKFKKELEKRLDIDTADARDEFFDLLEEEDVDLEVDEATGEVIEYPLTDFSCLSRSELSAKYEILKENYLPLALTANRDKIGKYTKARLKRLFKAFPEFEIIYTIKERMRVEFFAAKTAEEARKIAEKERKRLPTGSAFRPLRTYFKTLNGAEWSEHIYAYFDDPVGHRFSNAALESINRHIKDINRMSHSLTWEIFRLKILYGDIAIRSHGKRWKWRKDKELLMEYLSCALYRQDVSRMPDIDIFEYIFSTDTFQQTALGGALSSYSTERRIYEVLHNNNMAGSLLTFLQDNPEIVECKMGTGGEGIIRPLYVSDWDKNAMQILAVVDADAKAMAEHESLFESIM